MHSSRAVVLTRFLQLCRVVALVLLSPAVFNQPLCAQQTLGAINGTVTDSSGAVVPGANVKVRAVATNLSVTAETKSDGSFGMADLPIGTSGIVASGNSQNFGVTQQTVGSNRFLQLSMHLTF